MSEPLFLPALQCSMGTWTYYLTSMKMKDIGERVKLAEELHRNKELSKWIQRQIRDGRAQDIGSYLINQDERLFNALVVGVYGGHPQWAPVRVSTLESEEWPEFSADEEIELGESLGVVRLSGEENLFAIDGQHRAEGIRNALHRNAGLDGEDVAVILVGHKLNAVEKTRRLFTTLNRESKRVTQNDIIALDEDNGYAILTRQLVEHSETLQKPGVVAYQGQSSVRSQKSGAILSIITLYDVVKAFEPWYQRLNLSKDFASKRPSDGDLAMAREVQEEFWSSLVLAVPEVALAIADPTFAPKLRKSNSNHLLFRPPGLLAFAAATVSCLLEGMRVAEAVGVLAKVDMWLHHDTWQEILWDPSQEKMLTGSKNRRLAASHLLQMAALPAASQKEGKLYLEFLEGRKSKANSSRRQT
jgi:DNA sulfur modification protein DndB